jgi:D-3-phosphoglycerate dehydrogenase / 2-oxoglutarate reductase
MRVVIWSNVGRHMPGWTEAFAVLREAGHDVVDPGPADMSEERALEVLAEADAALVSTNPVPRRVLEAAPRLTIVSKVGIGVDNIDQTAATELGIRVTNTPGTNADAVADHAIALALAVMRDIPRLDGLVREGRGWDAWPFVGAELACARVAVLGTGHIGRAVIRRLVGGFSATVVAYDPFPDESLVAQYGVTYGSLDEALTGADLVMVHVPLVEATRNLIGARELGLLKPSAFLVNPSRGGIVDEEALAAAVREGRLAGAGVDVFSVEPALTNVLFDVPRIVVTPHVAGHSAEGSTRSRVGAATNIVNALAGVPTHQVNGDDGVAWRTP